LPCGDAGFVLEETLWIQGDPGRADLVEGVHLSIGEIPLESGEVVGELGCGATAQQHRADRRPVPNPVEGDLAHGGAPAVGDRVYSVEDLPGAFGVPEAVRLDASRRVLAEPAHTGRGDCPLILAGEPAPAERRPGEGPDTAVHAEGNHLELYLPAEEVVLRLQRNNWGPAVVFRSDDGSLQLPCEKVGHADVADFSCPDEAVESFQGLFDWRPRVPGMDLVEIDSFDPEPPQAGVDGAFEMDSARPAVGGVIAHCEPCLGGDSDPFDTAPLRQPAADDLLGCTAGVDVCGVDERPAGLEVGVEDCVRGLLIRLMAEGHRPQSEYADL